MGLIGTIASGVSSLFGGKSSKSSSGNQAYGDLSNIYGGSMKTGTGATDMLGALLGVGGDQAGANSAFQNYLKSTGYQNTVNAGTNAIAGNAAARGLLGSGGTLRAMSNFGQNQMGNYFNNFLGQLLGLGKLGQGAGALVEDAGKTQSSSGSENRGLIPSVGGFLGSLKGTAL